MSWLPFALAAVITAASVHLLTQSLAGILTRVPAATWLVVRVAGVLAMLGFAGWIALAPAHRAVPVPCIVTEVTTEPRSTGELDVRVRVRWQAANREFHVREPIAFGRERGDAAEVTARHANQRVPCYVASDRPSRIFLGDSARANLEQWTKAAAIAVPAIALLVLAIVRRPRDQRRAWAWISSRGVGGMVGLVLLLIGMLSRSWLVGGASGAWMLWLFGREIARTKRAVSYLTKQLPLAPQPTPEQMFASLHGTREGAVIELVESLNKLAISVELVGWPEGVSITPATDTDPVDGTGDRAFDARFGVHGPEDRWRGILTHDVRAALGEVLGVEASHIEHGRWRATYEDDVADGKQIEHDIERALALARLVPTNATATPHERVLAVAREEPDAIVRFGHYRWLVADGYPAAAVALAAADDPDDTIRAWVRDQVVPADGAFR